MARPKVLVCQHVPYEPLGILDPLLKAAGFRIRYVNFGRNAAQVPSLDGYDGVIVLGGPMNADDTENYPHLQTEVLLIRAALQRNLRVLGICLGAQLLAKAIGGSVAAGGAPEVGWHTVELTDAGHEDPMFAGFGGTREVFQWHDDKIVLPDSARVIAGSATCPVQSFSCGDGVYGLQFHLEANAPLIERWLGIPDYQHALHRNGVSADAIRQRTESAIGPMMDLGRHAFSRWIEHFEHRTRRTVLPSR